MNKLVITFYILAVTSLYGLEFSLHEDTSKTLNAIMATGKIKHDDVINFDKYLSKLPAKKHTAIYFNSDGGSLAGGILLGMYFKKYHIKTLIPNKATCASSCALAFLGGTDYNGDKWMTSASNSRLGFHAFSNSGGTKYENLDSTQSTVAEILKYGEYVDAPMEIFIKTFSTPAKDIYWFSMAEQLRLGINIWDIDKHRFIKNDHYNNEKYYIVQSAQEACKVWFNKQGEVAKTTCLSLTNSKGVRILCTHKKTICKTELELTKDSQK